MIADLRYELFRGLAYRSIEHRWQFAYTTALPISFSATITLIYWLVPEKLGLLGKDGILASALSIVSTLPGFYFAGLAAVSTFGGADMDKDMPSPAPELTIRHKGVEIKTVLSRRKYMSYLFSYLVFISFALCGLILSLNSFQPSLINLAEFVSAWKYGANVAPAGEFFCVFVLALLASSLAITTLQGLFFLSERIHQP